MSKQWLIGALILVVTAQPALGDDDAESIIVRAIEAQGGKDAVAKKLCCRQRMRQILYLEDRTLNLVADSWRHFGGREKTVITVLPDEKTTINVLNRDQAWTTSLTTYETREWSEREMAEVRDNRHAAKVCLLFPLLEDSDFSLSLLEENVPKNKTRIGVKATREGYPPVLLYFDEQTYLPVKIVKTVRGVQYEEYLHGFKVCNGVIVEKRATLYKDGQLLLESETVDLEPLKSIDPATFAKPE